MDESFKLLDGVTATDEKGAPLAVTLVDDGGFNVWKVGEYTVTYSAQHTAHSSPTYATRKVTVKKTAEQEKYLLTFILADLTFRMKDSKASITKDAKALDEGDNPVDVELVSDGGFDIKTIGVYTATYKAVHPVTKEVYTQERTITVLSAADFRAYQRENGLISGDSGERYSKYLQYRNEIVKLLQPRMASLTSMLNARINAVKDALGATSVVLYKPMPTLLDDAAVSSDELASVTDLAESPDSLAFPLDDTPSQLLSELMVSNWSDMLAVYVAKNSLDIDDPLDIINLRKLTFDDLDEVFWSMNTLTYHVQDGVLRIMISGSTYTQGAELFSFTPDQLVSLEELMQPEFQSVFASLTGNTAFDDLSADEAAQIRSTLPEGLNMQREAVVLAARSLLGKVSYFWGGKYPEIGWNPLWGIPKRVTSEGSTTSGLVRPYGLDCSGFVTWSFINAANDTSIIDVIGNGSANQWSRSTKLGYDEAQPGDLAFRAIPGSVDINHVGIVAYKLDDGDYMIVHCSSSKGEVVLTKAWESGFRYMRRPLLYGE